MKAIEYISYKRIIGLEKKNSTTGINKFLHSGERRETDQYDGAL
jgi:hypothetical protein